MKSTDLTVRISIFSESETGPLQWEETHSATTNEFGLFTLQIGAGTRTNGLATNFSDIIWGLASHFLKVEVDAGNDYEDMGTTQLLPVPYALNAKSVSSLKMLNIREIAGNHPDSALFEVKNQEGNTVVLIEAMKEQQKMIEELQTENKELAQLKKEIEELKMSLGLLSRKE